MDIKELLKLTQINATDELHQLAKYKDLIEQDRLLQASEIPGISEYQSEAARLAESTNTIKQITLYYQSASPLQNSAAEQLEMFHSPSEALLDAESVQARHIAQMGNLASAYKEQDLFSSMQGNVTGNAASFAEYYGTNIDNRAMEGLVAAHTHQDLYYNIQSKINNSALVDAYQDDNINEAYNALINNVNSFNFHTVTEQLDIFDSSSKELMENAAYLSGLAKYTALDQALNSAHSIYDDFNRVSRLTDIAQELEALNTHRAHDLFQEAIEQASHINLAWIKADALNEIAGKISYQPELQETVLDMALSLHDQRAIPVIAKILHNNPPLNTYEKWTKWLHKIRTHSQLLECIDDLAQAAVQLTGNPKQAEEIAQAVMDVGKWWP